MLFIIAKAARKLRIVTVCGIGGAPSCGLQQIRRVPPLSQLTQTLIHHLWGMSVDSINCSVQTVRYGVAPRLAGMNAAILQIIIGLTCTFFFLALALYRVPLGLVGTTLANANPIWIAA